MVPGQWWDQLGLRVDTQKPGEALGCHGRPRASPGKSDSSARAAALGSGEVYVPQLLCADYKVEAEAAPSWAHLVPRAAER